MLVVKKLFKALKLFLVMAMLVCFVVPLSAYASEVPTLPANLPADAPTPDPHSEVVTVYFYINDRGETVVYDPAMITPQMTVIGDTGLTRSGMNSATLSGTMIDSVGISFTAPNVTSYYYK